MARKIVIVGGVAGGATCAARLRRLSEDDEIVLIERGEHISFANCGLPYFVGDVIKEKKKLLVMTPDHFRERFNVDVRTRNEVLSIDRAAKKVKVKAEDGREYEESYDYLVLAPGAQPIRPPLPGIDDERVFSLRTVPDAERIKEYVESSGAESAVVVGGGFIGLEMAENLHNRGIRVTVVEKLPQVMPNLDEEVANVITQHMKLKRVNFQLGVGIAGFSSDGDTFFADLDNGEKFSCDLAILSIGVRPDTAFLKDSGLELEKNGAIKVDRKMQTGDKNIFAVGDAVIVDNPILGNKWGVALAWPANRQARVVADTINGEREEYPGTIGTSVVKIFDLTVAATGCSERYLKMQNVKYQKIYVHPSHHVTYYPGAVPISMKVIFDPENAKILGAQMVGSKGVDKRIDVIATAIRCNAKVTDLKNMECAYAPPYGAAKDPVNVAGMVAENILSGKVDVCHWDEIDGLREAGYVFLDVRTEDEFKLGTMPGSTHIPVDELRDRIGELPKDMKYVVFCQVGLRGYVAARMLSQMGFAVKNLSGGYRTYKHATDTISSHFVHDEDEVESEEMMAGTQIKKSDDIIVLDACGLACPGPISETAERMKDLSVGQILEIRATDQGFASDIKAWAESTGNSLMSVDSSDGVITASVMKGAPQGASAAAPKGDEKTIVVFSGDFDKVMSAFIIANGAVAMGRKVNMFFTFWGLNALKKQNGPSRKKDFLSKMFGWMMPSGINSLKLSKLNMGGMGTSMMKYVMKKKNVDALPSLLGQAQKSGIKIVACQMTMDVMGISKDELIDGIEFGGVANFLADTDRSNATLFI